MKILVLRSEKSRAAKPTVRQYLQKFNVHYAQRILGNLRGAINFCAACGPDCIFCRKPYQRRYDANLVGVFSFPSVLPYLLENPAEYLPKNVPTHDVLLVIHVHEQILLEFLKQCGSWGTRGVVVPLEAPDWISSSARDQARKICQAGGIEIAFPKPFCSFNPLKGGVLDQFRLYFHIGHPEVDLTVKDGIITRAEVNVSAACGATYYVARWLVGRNVKDNLEIEVISKRFHSYPCTASMKRDPELGDDTPLHMADIAHCEILSSLKEPLPVVPSADTVWVATPLGKMLPKPIPARENLEGIEAAEKRILNQLENQAPLTFDQLKGRVADLSPAAFISALLLLKKKGQIHAAGGPALKDQTWQRSA